MSFEIYGLFVTGCVSLALTKKDRSRVSAEDILTHDDPRAAVLVRLVRVLSIGKSHILCRLTLNYICTCSCNCLTTSAFFTRKEFRSNRPKPAACKFSHPHTHGHRVKSKSSWALVLICIYLCISPIRRAPGEDTLTGEICAPLKSA